MSSASSWQGTSSSFSYYYAPPLSEVREALQPLIERLRAYDTLRVRLEREGGDLADLQRLTMRLADPILLRGREESHEVRLAGAEALRQTLNLIGARNVYFAVRVLPSSLPAYYVVRVKHGYWSEYSLLVEDLYRSPDYPHPDERFVKLMDFGHETYFLRLSQFREGVAAQLCRDRAAGSAGDREVDEVLHEVGRRIFQAAWHEDQYSAFEAAEHFGLPCFRRAIELLYLCLSGDLCAIRASIDSDVSNFFDKVYPQPAIRAFLRRIGQLEGNALARLPDDALQAFTQLSRGYGKFLRVDVRHGSRGCPVPLYKLLFANFGRLDRIAPHVASDGEVAGAARRLEERAAAVIQQIADCSAAEASA